MLCLVTRAAVLSAAAYCKESSLLAYEAIHYKRKLRIRRNLLTPSPGPCNEGTKKHVRALRSVVSYTLKVTAAPVVTNITVLACRRLHTPCSFSGVSHLLCTSKARYCILITHVDVDLH